MPVDFLFSLENRPGTGARILWALGHVGINVIGFAAVSGGQTVHLTVEDRDAAATGEVLEGAGVSIQDERDVLVVPVEDSPGAGAALLQRLADAGINVDFSYLATATRLVIGVKDPARAKQALLQ